MTQRLSTIFPDVDEDDDDDDEETVMEDLYDNTTSSSPSRPIILRLTTFKPSAPPTTVPQPAEERSPSAETRGDRPAATIRRTAKPAPAATTASVTAAGVVSTAAAVGSSAARHAALERLQPDLLPLMSTSAVADDASVAVHGRDDLA